MDGSPTKESTGKTEEKNAGQGKSKKKQKKDKTKRQEKEATAKSADPKINVVKQPRGLHNFGNLCYFNSVMQPLCQTHSLHSQCDPRNGKITSEFLSMSDKMANGETVPFDASQLREAFVKAVKRFDNRGQHDSHECIRHFLDEVRKEERNTSPGYGLLTAVDKIFGGHLVTVYICKECDKHYHLFEPCLDISLPVFFEDEEERNVAEKSKHNSNIDENCRMPSQSEGQVNEVEPEENEPVCCFGLPKRKKRSNTEEESKTENTPTNHNSGKAGDSLEKYQTNNKQTNGKMDRKYEQTISTLMTPLSSDSNSTANLSKALTDKKARRHSRRRSFAVEKKSVNLHECLTHFSRVEQIRKEYLCEDCLREAMAREEADEDNLKLTSATKQTLIFNPPAILTIHFKRFELLPGRSRKRPDMVKYPEDLDIAPYCSSQCLRNDPPRKNIWYSLYAVIVHSGSLESGHYTAYVKVREKVENIEKLKTFIQKKYFNHNVTSNELITMIDQRSLDLDKLAKKTNTKNGKTSRNAITPERVESKWYSLNDSSVHEVRIEKVLEQEAYLLFYERVGDAEDNGHVAESNAIYVEERPESNDTALN